MEILLVENDAEVRGGLSAFLRSRGFHVETATTRTSEKAMTTSLNVVISGYRMGYDQISHLIALRDDQAPDVPVIVTVTTGRRAEVLSTEGVELIDAQDGVGRLLQRLQQLKNGLHALEKTD